MFQVDADCFKIELPNGFVLTFFPCDEQGTPAHLQRDFNEDNPKPQPRLRMNVSGNGTNVNHTVLDAGELALQIQSFAAKRTPA